MPFVDFGGTRLHFNDLGPDAVRPPLVLLHAFPLHSEMWAPQLSCLSSRFRVIAPDLSGFGRSDTPEDPASYGMARYADEVMALLDALALEEVVLGGLSMGGYVAFACLRLFPERIAGLVLADTRAAADSSEVLARRSDQQEQVLRDGTGKVVEALIPGLLGDHSFAHRPELVGQVRRLMGDNPAAGYVGALEAMKQRPDATDELAGIGVPTLVLVGEQDRLSPPEVVREWQQRIPGSRLTVLPDAGHLSNLEAADAFNTAVGDLLDDL
ncbi:MAG: alpha/beta fold hydrolase [Acidimicrobiales bacterium]